MFCPQGWDHWYYAIVFLRSQRHMERVINLIGGERNILFKRKVPDFVWLTDPLNTISGDMSLNRQFSIFRNHHCLFIDYNTEGVPGKDSCILLHCVAIT